MQRMDVHDYMQSILALSSDAIITKQLDGTITSWNGSAEAILGYAAQEVVGHNIRVLFPEDRLHEEDLILGRIRQGERVRHFNTVRLRKGGQPVHLSVSLSPLHDEAGQLVGVVKVARDITDTVNAMQLAQHHQALVASSDDAIVSKTLDGTVTSWNKGAERVFGYTAEEMLGTPIRRLIPEALQHEEDAILRQIALGLRVDHFETVRRHRDGHLVDISVTVSPIRDLEGRVVGASKIARDISDRKLADARLQLISSVFSHTSEGIVITDATGTILEVNEAFSKITGYDRADALGQSPRMFHSSRQGPEVFESMWQGLSTQGQWQGEIWSRRKDGEAYAGLLTVSAAHDASGHIQRYVALFSDITPLRKQQERIEHIAHYDPLTDLPNRVLLSDRLKLAMVSIHRSQQSLALLYMDLDGFKAVNDQLGHDAGDQLLIEIAHRMKNVLREGDTLARMGGDEFVALLNGVDNTHDVELVIERLLHACSQPWTVGGQVVQVSASIGVTLYPHDLVEVDQLLRHADQAMYQAKQAGRNRYHLFDPVHDTQMKERRQMQESLREALNADQFVLHYQPQVNMATGEVVGMEALVRWNKDGQGLVGPGAFLPHLEGTDLGYALETWVLNQALTDMAQWQQAGLRVPVAVNISAPHLQHRSFPERLNEVLAAHPNVSARHLELEIVETSALDDLENVSRTMAMCHELGVRFAVDDFGTGYSSLTYLKRLPAETLKIDQSFVRDMLIDQEDMAIVQGVIGLAVAFNRQVVAEGVETMAQLRALIALGCQRGQGFGIGRPMPVDRLTAWVADWHATQPWVQA